MKNKYKEIVNELEKAELSIKTVREILDININTRIITTPKEFENAIKEASKYLSSSDKYSSIQTTKHRLLNLTKRPDVKEAYEIQEKFGIPIYAWKDIGWYRQSLKPDV